MSELNTDADLEKSVPSNTRTVKGKSSSDDHWATECPFCHGLAVEGGPQPNTCTCGQTQVNQAGQVFGLVHGSDSYWENKPNAVVRTLGEFKALFKESGQEINLVE